MISMSMFTFDAMAATLEVYFINIQDILSFPLLASASVVVPFDIVRRVLKLFALLSPFSTRKTFVFGQCCVNKFAWWKTRRCAHSDRKALLTLNFQDGGKETEIC